MPLHFRMLIGVLVGAIAGVLAFLFLGDQPLLAALVRYVARPIGQIFLRSIFMLVIPLLFSALVLGIVGLGDPRRLGRIGLKTLAYTAAVSAIAVVIGIVLVNTMRPGEGLSAELRERLTRGAAERAMAVTSAPVPKSGLDFLVQIVPDNPIAAAASGHMLGVMFFALVFGIGLASTPGESARRLTEVIQGLYDVTMRLIEVVLRFAPYGVAALLFSLTSELGYEILAQLARYVLVVLLALAIHQFVVY
ncbi:MAG: dicarboxylate/amino acid:cation symporter, partial [Candidatus Binatia bacterium]